MIRAILRNAGFHPRNVLSALRGWQRYVDNRRAFRAQLDPSDPGWGKELPILTEWNESSGSLGPYFFQDQLVARWVREYEPLRHVDVGSRLDGFVGSLSVFREVDVLDIRPQPLSVHNVRFHQLDLMTALPPEWVDATDSLSCLHTIEHFGLGRYGDPIDVNGHLKGLSQLKRMVKPGGMFYLSTPIGPECVEFNAHRIFSVNTLTGWFSEEWRIERFAVIGEDNRVREYGGSDSRDGHGDLRRGVGIVAARKNPIP